MCLLSNYILLIIYKNLNDFKFFRYVVFLIIIHPKRSIPTAYSRFSKMLILIISRFYIIYLIV